MHYYQFNIGDYASHTAHLDELEDLAYRRMLDYCYLNEIGLPKSVEETARLIRMRTHCERIAVVLREFFFLDSEGSWRHERVERELEAFREKSNKSRKAARKRWDSGDADALPAHSERNAKQEPLTTNQEPVKETTTTSAPSASADPVPYEAVVDLYHEVLHDLPKVQILNSKRKAAIRQRHTSVMSKSLDNWRLYFEAAFQSDFLMGRIDGKDWRADFDFLISERGVTGVIEAKYHAKNRPATNTLQHPARAPTPAERVAAKRAAAGSPDVGAVVENVSNVRPYLVEGSRG